MFVAGAYITIPGGGGELNGVVPNGQLPADMRLGVSATPEEARDGARSCSTGGVDFLKLIATGAVLAIGTEPGEPELTEDQMRAAVRSGHGARQLCHRPRPRRRGHQGRDPRRGALDRARQPDRRRRAAMAKDAGVWLVMDIFNGDWIDEVGTREGWPEEYLRKNRETTEVQREGSPRR